MFEITSIKNDYIQIGTSHNYPASFVKAFSLVDINPTMYTLRLTWHDNSESKFLVDSSLFWKVWRMLYFSGAQMTFAKTFHNRIKIH
jgi:hypothetical protein